MCAEGGGAAYIEDSFLMDNFRTQASAVGGLSYSENFMKKIARAVHPKHDEKWQEFFAITHNRYKQDMLLTHQYFGQKARKSLGPMMTGLIEVSGDVLGKEGEYFDGSRHLIQDGDDFIEFLHNCVEGVTVVFDGMTPEGNLDIRIANKNLPETHERNLIGVRMDKKPEINESPLHTGNGHHEDAVMVPASQPVVKQG